MNDGDKGFSTRPNIKTVHSALASQGIFDNKEESVQEIQYSKSTSKEQTYKVFFQINIKLENNKPSMSYTYIKSINEIEAEKLALEKISRVYEISVDNVEITSVSVYKNEMHTL